MSSQSGPRTMLKHEAGGCMPPHRRKHSSNGFRQSECGRTDDTMFKESKHAKADMEKSEQPADTTAPQPKKDVDEFPEGGVQAWLTVLGAVLVQFACGFANAFGVFQDFFVIDFLNTFNSSQISWIGSVAVFVPLASGLVSGRLVDSGYLYLLMVFGGVISVLCIFMLSLAQPQQYYQVFLTLGLGCGLGFGAVYVPSLVVCAHYFRRRRALAMGIAAAGNSLGAMLHPIMLNNLIHGKLGFANGVRASGGLVAGCFIVALLIMRTRLPPQQVQQASVLTAAKKFVKDDVYVLTIFGVFLVVQGVFFPLFYIQLYCDQHGIGTQTFRFYTLTIISGASAVGRIVGGAVAPRFGVFNGAMASSILTGALVFAMLALRSVAGVIVWSIVYGFTSGVVITLLGPLLASLATDVSEVGLRVGLAYAFTGIGALIATPITGALLSKHFLWWRPIVYIGVATTVGGIVVGICRFTVSSRKGMTVV